MNDAGSGAPGVLVVYALPERQFLVDVEYVAPMTAADAVSRSGLPQRFAEIDETDLVLGVWGVEVTPGFLLRAGDRVEISRPLLTDPRDLRRELLHEGRVMGGANAVAPAIRKKDRA